MQNLASYMAKKGIFRCDKNVEKGDYSGLSSGLNLTTWLFKSGLFSAVIRVRCDHKKNEGRCNIDDFEDRERKPKIEECKQPLEAEKGKETDSLGACRRRIAVKTP